MPKFPKSPNSFHKHYKFGKNLLKFKRKEKCSNKNNFPDTPHNTGQYLSHIHQEKTSKNKNSNEEEAENINLFDCNDDEDLIDDDFEFNRDTRRERLMSLEGKELNDFLFNANESEKKEKLVNSCIEFGIELKENHETTSQNHLLNI